jgi:hypothetical protein
LLFLQKPGKADFAYLLKKQGRIVLSATLSFGAGKAFNFLQFMLTKYCSKNIIVKIITNT